MLTTKNMVTSTSNCIKAIPPTQRQNRNRRVYKWACPWTRIGSAIMVATEPCRGLLRSALWRPKSKNNEGVFRANSWQRLGGRNTETFLLGKSSQSHHAVPQPAEAQCGSSLKSTQSDAVCRHRHGLHERQRWRWCAHMFFCGLFTLIWLPRLQSGGVWLTTLYLYMYIYIYRYNTVLVNKVEGFHIVDRGTELKILFSRKHA